MNTLSVTLLTLLLPQLSWAGCELGLDNGVVIIDESAGEVSTGTARVCANAADSARVLGNARCRMAGTAVTTEVQTPVRDVRFSSRTGAQIAEELKRGLGITGTRVIPNSETDTIASHATAIRHVRGMRAQVGIYTSTTVVHDPHAAVSPGEMGLKIRIQATAQDNFGRHLAGGETEGTLRIKDPACQTALKKYFADKRNNSVPDCIYNRVIESEDEYTDTGMALTAKPHHSPAFAAGRKLMQQLSVGCNPDGRPAPGGGPRAPESLSAR